MKLRNAKTYRNLTKKAIPRFGKIMDHIANSIARSAEHGYTKTIISVGNVLTDVGIDIDESRFSSVVNLIIKELVKRKFTYRYDDETISVYW